MTGQLNDDQLLAVVQSEAPVQNAIHSPTIQPIARFGVATKLPRAEQAVTIDDARWETIPSLGLFFTQRPGEGLARDMEAKAAYTDEVLCVRIVAHGAPLKKNFIQNFWMNDTLELFVDPAHDHYNYCQFVLMGDGQKISSACWKSCGTQRWEIRGGNKELSITAWSGSVQLGSDTWTALFVIPFATLGAKPEAGRPFGLNILRQRCEVPWEWRYWNFSHRGAHSPWGFGDLYFEKTPVVHVDQVDLGEVRLWENRGTLHLRNLTSELQALRLDVTVKGGKNEEHTSYTHSHDFELATTSDPRAAIPFVFPFDPQEWKYQHLYLSIHNKAGARLWAGTYRIGYETGWMLHIDDHREGPAVANPAPEDPEFFRKKRAYIIRSLPKFVRKTTAQGAPSDFTLEAADGSIQFDLMRAGALQRMADYIYDCYDNDLDRLLGATMFIHQRALVAYAHVPTSLATRMSPLSIIRLGNAQCGSQAEALCGILEKMRCAATGKPYRTRNVTYFAHVVAVAEFGGKWVHLDPSLGRYYFLPGNTILASMEELIAEPALATEQSPYLVEMLRKTQKTDMPFYGHTESGIWPPGAPEE